MKIMIVGRSIKTRILTSHKIKPTTIISFLLVGLFLITGKSLVSSESLYISNIPYPISHPIYRLQQAPNSWKTNQQGYAVQSLRDPEDGNENRDFGEIGKLLRKIESIGGNSNSVNEDGVPSNSGYKNIRFRYGGESMREASRQLRQNPSYEEQQRQSVPLGLLLSKQFLQPSNTKIFNQPNGMLIGEASLEPEKNDRGGLLSNFNEFDIKHIPHSRPSQLLLVGNPNFKRNSIREGYMCHFKLCQLGASGKRRWSPLFEYD